MTRSSYTWTPPWLRRGDEWEVGFEKFKIMFTSSHFMKTLLQQAMETHGAMMWCNTMFTSSHGTRSGAGASGMPRTFTAGATCQVVSVVSVMRQKAWEFSSLFQWNVGSLHVFQLQWLWCFSWIRIPPPALQKWAPPPQSAAKSLRCILPQRLAKINIKQSFQFRCKNGLNNWLVQSLSHKCIYSITFYLKTTTRDQPKWAQSFGNEIESQGSQVSAFQP